MPTFNLKSYQAAALNALTQFARDAQLQGAASAYGMMTNRPYNPDPFGQTPCVCLRIPTGGGKTLLASHAIATLAREWRATDAPVAVWLVPSDAIRSQTLKALQAPGHPYREALEASYSAGLRVCALEEVANIAPPEWGRQAIVLVATIQSFRIDDTDKRNVYSFSELFERHFKGCDAQRLAALHSLPNAVVTTDEAAQDGKGVLKGFVNQARWSLANWLALHEPILIVDEAHNTKTDKSFTALKRLNPSIILELTATPIPNRTNVLYHVSAQELAAESMIKLPIALAEHPQGWQQAVFAAVQTQRALETAAMKDEAKGLGYVRPIVLFQAQNINDEVPPEKLRKHLQEDLHIPAERIAEATGTRNELDDVDLNSRSCQIRFVITVQALREGWDCPFAYVLCSLQKLSSATAVEQLLGRVLRMPYASARGTDTLNRAYAHVCETQFSSAAQELADRLINNMGFEALDVASMIASQSTMPLFEGLEATSISPQPVETVFSDLSASQALAAAPGVKIVGEGDQTKIVLTGHISQETESLLLEQVRGAKKQEKVREKVAQHNALNAAQTSHSFRGERFAPIPTLGYRVTPQGQLWPLERESVLEAVELDLITPDAVHIQGFQVIEQSNTFDIYLKDERVRVRTADASQIAFDYASTTITPDDLVRWLDQSLHQRMPEFTQAQRSAYLMAVVNYLMHEQGLPLVALAKARFKLAQDIEHRVADVKESAAKAQFRQFVLEEAWTVQANWDMPFVFQTNQYPAPALSRYAGRYEFRKHFFPVLADLKDDGEEFHCAQLIDNHSSVKHWVRNLDRAPAGYSLPTSKGRFFPDFIAELKDGRIAVLEYKGAHLLNDPYEIEKRLVGELWAKRSDGRCVFSWITLLREGKSMSQQIDALLQ